MLVGALGMVVGMVSPATAWPHVTNSPQGNAYAYGQDNGNGNGNNQVNVAVDATTTTTVVDTNGANGNCGDYCPNGVGLPSGNGNGDGNATGQPCAGCVGNADDKNPPGQFKNGGDPNNGYECDGNNGIAKTNPAHTGCNPSPSTTVPPDCTHGNSHKPECTTTTTEPPGET